MCMCNIHYFFCFLYKDTDMVPGLHFRPLYVLFTSCTFSSLHCPGFLSIVSDPSLFLSFFWPMVLPLCLLCSLPVDLSFTHLESYTALHFYCPVTCTKPFWCLRAHVSPIHLDVTIFEDMPAVTLGASEISVLGALRKQLTFVWDRQSRVQCLHGVYLWEMAFWVCLSIIQAWWMFLHLPRGGLWLADHLHHYRRVWAQGHWMKWPCRPAFNVPPKVLRGRGTFIWFAQSLHVASQRLWLWVLPEVELAGNRRY